MAQNRKTQAASAWVGAALKAFMLCLLIGGAGVGYVWQKSQVKQLGDQLKRREQSLAELKLGNEKLRQQLATLVSPRFLEQRVRELNLGLMPPQPAQIMSLPEPVGWPTDPEAVPPAQFAAHPPKAG